MSSITEKVRDTLIEIGRYIPSYKLDKLVTICNRIDAKYKELERKLENSIQLPVDHDGVPIKLCDKMVGVAGGGEVLRVDGVGVQCFFAWDNERCSYRACCADRWRHYKPDSWDLIIHDAICGGDEDELVARCKALAGEAK